MISIILATIAGFGLGVITAMRIVIEDRKSTKTKAKQEVYFNGKQDK